MVDWIWALNGTQLGLLLMAVGFVVVWLWKMLIYFVAKEVKKGSL